jgi:2-amino-4-hydroxy-6-hydroxymethyldihydropteridine diphosphokinase
MGMNGIYLLLGSNMGDSVSTIAQARTMVGERIGSERAYSRLYRTAAWGLQQQADFLNQMLCINTSLTPLDLLKSIQSIENDLGRIRDVHWGPRTIDIDIIYYHNQIIEEPTLIVPHPHIVDRRFTLSLLVELCPDAVHPLLLKTHQELLDSCTDQSMVAPLSIH